MSLTAKTKLRTLIEIISNASEFANMPIRYKEDIILKQLADRLSTTQKHQKFTDPHVKVLLIVLFTSQYFPHYFFSVNNYSRCLGEFVVKCSFVANTTIGGTQQRH